MALHFSQKEFSQRITLLNNKMEKNHLDAILLFRQESMYYLTGYDTFGYVFFQTIILKNDGTLILLTRLPDLRQAQLTSIIKDIRIWVDHPDVNPIDDLKNILKESCLANKKIGIEYDAYGLTAKNGILLNDTLAGFCDLSDASNLVNELRVIKSETELQYVRKAAELTDLALEKTVPLIRPHAFEGDILASLQGVIFQGGGEYSGNEFIIGSGSNALLCRSFAGRRHLDEQDQMTLEFAGTYNHYHTAMMRTILIGEATMHQRKMFETCEFALIECENALKIGDPIGNVFDAYARVCDSMGMKSFRLNATGYSLGTTFAPNWMDWPMFYKDNPILAQESMIFFIHIILMDSQNNNAMTLGHTVIVKKENCERLSQFPISLLIQ